MKTYLFSFLLILSLSSVHAQKTVIKGQVLDASTQQSIPGVSVYIDGSFVGTASDGDGFFYLDKFPKPPYRLTISSIGYQTAVAEITEKTKTVKVYLEPKLISLQEVVIKASDREGWKKFGADFLENFVGYSAFSKECKIKNPEVVFFVFDDKNYILKVHTNAPLIIENNALGFLITYWLEDFEFNFLDQTVFYKGSSQFQDMANEKTRKRRLDKWIKNRESAYLGSVQHFISVLYNNSLEESGFRVRAMEKIILEDYYKDVPKKRDTIIYTDSTMDILSRSIDAPFSSTGFASFRIDASGMAKRFERWYHEAPVDEIMRYKTFDSTSLQTSFCELEKYGDAQIIVSRYPLNEDLESRAIQGVVNNIDSTLIKESDIVLPLNKASKLLEFKNYLHITYLKEYEEEAFQLRVRPRQAPVRKYQTNTVTLRDVDAVTIFSTGYFEPAYGLFFEDYWSFEKIDKLLPLEYVNN